MLSAFSDKKIMSMVGTKENAKWLNFNWLQGTDLFKLQFRKRFYALQTNLTNGLLISDEIGVRGSQRDLVTNDFTFNSDVLSLRPTHLTTTLRNIKGEEHSCAFLSGDLWRRSSKQGVTSNSWLNYNRIVQIFSP